MAAEDPNVEIGMLINNTLTIVKGAGMMVLKLIQYMIALKKQQRLTQAQYDSIIQFARDTEGDFTIANIPTQDPEKIAQFQESLRSGGVAFCDLPDLDVGDGLTQVAIRNKDFARFQYIFEEFSKTQLSGGLKDYVELKNNTSGNLTLHNIPLGSNYGKVASIGETAAELVIEHGNDPVIADYIDKHPVFRDKARDQIKQMVMDEYLNQEGHPNEIEELLQLFPLDRSQSAETVNMANQALRLSEEVSCSPHFTDFRNLIRELEAQKVSYAIMPDLNIKDDYTQIAVANIHEGRFKEALKSFLREGAFASEMSIDDYYNTGMMNPEEYTESASEETTKTVEKAKAAARGGHSKDWDPKTAYEEVSNTMTKQSEAAKYEHYAALTSDSPDTALQEIRFSKEEIMNYDPQNETARVYYPGTEIYFEVSPAVPIPGNNDEIACFFDMRSPQPIREFRKEIDAATGLEKTVVRDVSAREALTSYRDNLAAKQYAPFEGAWTSRVKGSGKTANVAEKTTEAMEKVVSGEAAAKTINIAEKTVSAATTASSIISAGNVVKAAETAGKTVVKTFEAMKSERGIAP